MDESGITFSRVHLRVMSMARLMLIVLVLEHVGSSAEMELVSKVPEFVDTLSLPIEAHPFHSSSILKRNGKWDRLDSLGGEHIGERTFVLIYYNGKVLGKALATINENGCPEPALSPELRAKLDSILATFKKQRQPDYPDSVQITVANRSTLSDPEEWNRAEIPADIRALAKNWMATNFTFFRSCTRSPQKLEMVKRSTAGINLNFNHRSFHSVQTNTYLIGVKFKGVVDYLSCTALNSAPTDGRNWIWLILNNRKIFASHKGFLPLDAANYFEKTKSHWLIQVDSGEAGEGEIRIVDLKQTVKFDFEVEPYSASD